MHNAIVLGGLLGLLVLAAGCSERPKEWLKVDQRYTTEDFRRDYAACSKGGKLDEECMKSRGWVAVRPGKEEKAPPPSEVPGRPRGRY